PEVKGVKVLLEIIRQTKSPKLRIYKYSPKKRTARRMGHRDKISYLRVQQIKV
ncbi:bL21 family ribosomal protein, partial [bacterium]|nr:bL21 family ribosomal protein [bacterium]